MLTGEGSNEAVTAELAGTGAMVTGSDMHQGEFNVTGPNATTVSLVEQLQPSDVAEIGIYRGDTTLEIARLLGPNATLHLFDFAPRVIEVTERLRAAGFTNVVGHPNSDRGFDSYNWSLMKVLRDQPATTFDYVFLDGAHTWQFDALAFLLADRLLRVGGHIDFDDYSWSLAKSPTMRPDVNPATVQLYTEEQIEESHVRLIVDVLVRRDPRYVEVVPNKLFQKVAPGSPLAGPRSGFDPPVREPAARPSTATPAEPAAAPAGGRPKGTTRSSGRRKGSRPRPR